MENYDNEDRELDLKALLERLSDTEIGEKVERALFRLKSAMEKVSENEDITELGKRCYADLSQARLALGEDGNLLDPFFAMFHGIFTSLNEEDLDPNYEYDEKDEDLEPEFTVLAVIPLDNDENPIGIVKGLFENEYPQYTIIESTESIEETEENHFFVHGPNGTLVSISYTEEDDKMSSLRSLIANTDTEISTETINALYENPTHFLEVYLAPESGITLSEHVSPDGLSNQMEKAEMAVRLIGSALEAESTICVFTNGRLYEKQEYSELVGELNDEEFMPADLFAYTYLEKVDEDENLIMTMGLSNWGFLEMFARTSDDDLEREEMFCAVQDLVNYILQRGIAIKDGDVVSYDNRTRYQFKFEDIGGQPIFNVSRLRPDDEIDIFAMNSEFHGPISWNRYEGLTCPLSFYWNDRKNVIMFHIPGSEASYEGFMGEYTYLLDNLTFIFEGIKDFFKSEEASNHKAIRAYMRRKGIRKEGFLEELLALKPTDVFLDPTVDSIKEGAPMLTVRYRERKNSRSYIEIGIDSNVQLAGIASI